MLAVITGASRGIGESYARQLAARGYALHVAARDAERLARVAGELRAAHGVAVEAILPEMRERRKGAIINVASVAGLLPLPYLSLYAATKAFLVSLGAALDLEARKHGVVIQTCCPGRTATDFHATAGIKQYWAPGDQ